MPKRVPTRLAGALGLVALAIVPPATAQTEEQTATHMLRRCEYGAAPNERAELMSDGVLTQAQKIANYLATQITIGDSETGENPDLLGLLGEFDVPALGQWDSPPAQPGNWTIEDLADVNIARALWSEYSLREKVTQFWQRHFSDAQGKMGRVLRGALPGSALLVRRRHGQGRGSRLRGLL